MANPEQLIGDAFRRDGMIREEDLKWLMDAAREDGVELVSFATSGHPPHSFAATLTVEKDRLLAFVERWVDADRSHSTLTMLPGGAADNPGAVIVGLTSSPSPFIYIHGQPALGDL